MILRLGAGLASDAASLATGALPGAEPVDGGLVGAALADEALGSGGGEPGFADTAAGDFLALGLAAARLTLALGLGAATSPEIACRASSAVAVPAVSTIVSVLA